MTTDTTTQKKPRKERKDNADKRRQQLMDATLRSIASNGLARTTLATVAHEAGLSQGVAVFYFKSKTGLLAGALQELYSRYDANWKSALAAAGDDPLDCLIAILNADFDPEICNAQALSIWFAFWGELKFTPQYAEVSEQYDLDRTNTIRALCAQLCPDTDPADIHQITDWIDTLTDGYWQHLHIFPHSTRRRDAARATLEMLSKLLPEHAGAIRNRL